MIGVIDPTQPGVARRIVEIQRVAYAVEAALIGFDEIPQLAETVEQIMARNDLSWRGAFDGGRLVGAIAWASNDGIADIDRLAVDPVVARKGFGRALVRAVPSDRTTIVSTGADNVPARDLYLSEGFVIVGRTAIAPGIFTTQFSRARATSNEASGR